MASVVSMTDECLMELFLDGNQGALETLVKRYEKPLFSFAFRMLGHRATAEDAFQETFLRVCRSRTRYQLGRRFKTWIYAICLNVCRDTLRRGQRRREVPLQQKAAVRDDLSDPAETAAALFEAARVRRALAQLPRKQSEVVVLAYYQGLRYSEIAQVLDIPLGTVKSRNHNAMRNMVRFLER